MSPNGNFIGNLCGYLTAYLIKFVFGKILFPSLQSVLSLDKHLKSNLIYKSINQMETRFKRSVEEVTKFCWERSAEKIVNYQEGSELEEVNEMREIRDQNINNEGIGQANENAQREVADNVENTERNLVDEEN